MGLQVRHQPLKTPGAVGRSGCPEGSGAGADAVRLIAGLLQWAGGDGGRHKGDRSEETRFHGAAACQTNTPLSQLGAPSLSSVCAPRVMPSSLPRSCMLRLRQAEMRRLSGTDGCSLGCQVTPVTWPNKIRKSPRGVPDPRASYRLFASAKSGRRWKAHGGDTRSTRPGIDTCDAGWQGAAPCASQGPHCRAHLRR